MVEICSCMGNRPQGGPEGAHASPLRRSLRLLVSQHDKCLQAVIVQQRGSGPICSAQLGSAGFGWEGVDVCDNHCHKHHVECL
jgi:hypothetical protein